MDNSQGIRRMASSLAQAGAKETVFRNASLTLEEMSGFSLWRLHQLPRASVAELNLPAETGECQGTDPVTLCLRPGEWLVLSEPRDSTMPGAKPETKLDDALAAAVRSRKMVLRECSSGLAVFRLTGPGAPWLLNKLSGLDFQAGIAHGPHCARTRMVHAAVAVHYLGASPDGPAFNLIFDRSIARHLWELLTASAPHADELARSYGADTTD